MIKGNGKYSLLEFHGKDEIPYLRGTRIRSDVLYCFDYKSWQHNVSEIAKNRDLPLKAVRQAIEWCSLNNDLVTVVLAQENAEMDRFLKK